MWTHMYGSLLMAGEKRERTRTGRCGWALYRLSLLPVGETLVSLGSQSGVSSRGWGWQRQLSQVRKESSPAL